MIDCLETGISLACPGTLPPKDLDYGLESITASPTLPQTPSFWKRWMIGYKPRVIVPSWPWLYSCCLDLQSACGSVQDRGAALPDHVRDHGCVFTSGVLPPPLGGVQQEWPTPSSEAQREPRWCAVCSERSVKGFKDFCYFPKSLIYFSSEHGIKEKQNENGCGRFWILCYLVCFIQSVWEVYGNILCI